MIITIDTSKDSPEAIRKAISLLNELSGSQSSISSRASSGGDEKYVNIFDDNSGSAIGNSLNNIFGAIEEHKADAVQSAEKQPSLIMLDDAEKKESSASPDENSDVLSDEIIPYD